MSKFYDLEKVSRVCSLAAFGLTSAPVLFCLVTLSLPSSLYAAQKSKPKKSATRSKQVATGWDEVSRDLRGTKRSELVLPKSAPITMPTRKSKSLDASSKPQHADAFYDLKEREDRYERLLDAEIKQLYDLATTNKTSPQRGEIWLRLAERYIEKASLLDRRSQAAYDQRMQQYLLKKTKEKPKLNNAAAKEYNRRAIRLNEWFVRDFPKDPKVDQAYFFLGYNYFELGQPQVGEKYYQKLLQERPSSIFVSESNFALAEFYFEKDKWEDALINYNKVISRKNPRLLSFARYKAAWCLYRLKRTPEALQLLEQVVKMSRAGGTTGSAGRKTISKVRLGAEALKDYVPFFSEIGDYQNAWEEFTRIAIDEKLVRAMMERLAYIYFDTGNRPAAVYCFKKLIDSNPFSPKAPDYQHQVVLVYSSGDSKSFLRELDVWLASYSPESDWAKQNAQNPKLITDVHNLQETTVRNHVLQLHQGAQTSRAPSAQAATFNAYRLYLTHFGKGPKAAEMQFFFAELLFDMNRFVDSARYYQAAYDADPKGPYREKAIVNAVLALERDLPKEKELAEIRGDRTEKLPLDPRVVRFEAAAQRYLAEIPKGSKSVAIQRILGALYLQFNHHPEAQAIFEKIVREHPKTVESEIAGDLLIDSFQKEKNANGLVLKGRELLKLPTVAGSKLGARLRDVIERASYLRAEALLKSDPAQGAKEFEDFATRYKGSQHAFAARFKAAVAYEKAGDIPSAMRAFTGVTKESGSGKDVLAMQNDSRNALARLYQKSGQLEAAAREYEAYARANPGNAQAINGYYNAAVIFEALEDYNSAHRNYGLYAKNTKRADRIETLYREAEMYRKTKAYGRALPLYDEYINNSRAGSVLAVEAANHILQIHKSLGRTKLVKQWQQNVLGLAGRVGASKRDQVAKYIAEIKFDIHKELLNEFAGIRFSTSEKQQARAAQDIVYLKQKYINRMSEIVKLDYGPMIVAALASSGQMLDRIIATFKRIPTPKGYGPEEAKKYQELVQQQITQFQDEAKVAYRSAVERSLAFEYSGEWNQIARNGLRGLDPEFAARDSGEMASLSQLTDGMGL